MLKSLKNLFGKLSKKRNNARRRRNTKRRNNLNRNAEQIENKYLNQNKNTMNKNNKNTWLEAWKENVFIPFISPPNAGTYTGFMSKYKKKLYDTCKISDRKFIKLTQLADEFQQKRNPYSKSNINLFTNKFVKIAGMETLMCLGI